MESKNIAFMILAEMLPHIEAYSNSTNAKPSLEGFNHWMIEKKYDAQSKQIDAKKNAMHNKAQSKNDVRINSRIASGVGTLNRFVKLYAKNVFDNSVVKSIDEFTYLVFFQYKPIMSKTELIDRMLHEKSTGSEILKRLINHQLISETISKEDKRSKLVSITQKGKVELGKLFPILEQLSNTIVGDLTQNEKKVIDVLLIKLEKFHRQNHKC